MFAQKWRKVEIVNLDDAHAWATVAHPPIGTDPVGTAG